MECPGNPEHKGIKVIKLIGFQKQDTKHFAKVVCAVCSVWIKWLSKADYEYAMSLWPERVGEDVMEEVVEVQETDVERMERCISAAVEIDRSFLSCVRYCDTEDAILQIAFKLFDGRE